MAFVSSLSSPDPRRRAEPFGVGLPQAAQEQADKDTKASDSC
jgi:hypothetical protein